MEEAATKKDLKRVEERLDFRMDKIDASISDLTEIIKSFMQQVDERFNRVEERLDRLEEGHERLLRTIDSFINRIVSKKTGIPLV